MSLTCMTFQIHIPVCLILVSYDALARACLYRSLYPTVLLDGAGGQKGTLLPSRYSLRAILALEGHLNSLSSGCLAIQGFGSTFPRVPQRHAGGFILSSPIQAINQSIMQTVDVLPDVQGFHRVESTVSICEPTISPRTVEKASHGSFNGIAGGKRRPQKSLLSSFTRGVLVCWRINPYRAAMEATELEVSMFTRLS